MRLLVFGASGRTGRQLVEQALSAGHHVTAFVRAADAVQRDGDRLTVVQGDVRDPERVEEAVAGHDAVVSALGPADGSSSDEVSTGVGNIVEAMRRRGVGRIVVVGTAPCDAPGDRRSLRGRLARRVGRVLIGGDVASKEEQLRMLSESRLAWTALRPPRLTDGEGAGRYEVGTRLEPGLRSALARADLAAAMLAEVEADAHVGQAPFVLDTR
jgi:putative NADH-flavin reductase